MEDTLRYFFSAVFQGFAALITLGIMFYLYYLDKVSRKTDEIEKELLIYKPQPGQPKLYQEYMQLGLIKHLKTQYIKNGKYSTQDDLLLKLLTSSDSIIEKKKLLSNKMKALFKIARAILTLSLISLFLIGYYSWLDVALAVLGVISIILSIIFFSLLYAFSLEIIDGHH